MVSTNSSHAQVFALANATAAHRLAGWYPSAASGVPQAKKAWKDSFFSLTVQVPVLPPCQAPATLQPVPVGRLNNGGTEHDTLWLNECPGHAAADPTTSLQSSPLNCGLRNSGAEWTYGHLYAWTWCFLMDNLWQAQKQQNSTRFQFSGVILPDHALPGLTVAAKVSIEVTQEDEGIPRKCTL